MWDVTQYTHTGMSVPMCVGEDKETCRDVVRRYLRYCKRMGHPVVKLDRGEWEIQSREDACMVSDREGVLVVRRSRGRK